MLSTGEGKKPYQRALMAVREAIVARLDGSIHQLQAHRVDQLVPAQFPRRSRSIENMTAFLEQHEIEALDRHEILQIIEERRSVVRRWSSLVNCLVLLCLPY